MKRYLCIALAASLALSAAGAASAQPRDDRDHHGTASDSRHNHHDWRRGGRIEREDWARGSRVDWRAHHLRRPPHGYEWREVDGNYVLAGIAGGLIADLILNGH